MLPDRYIRAQALLGIHPYVISSQARNLSSQKNTSDSDYNLSTKDLTPSFPSFLTGRKTKEKEENQ